MSCTAPSVADGGAVPLLLTSLVPRDPKAAHITICVIGIFPTSHDAVARIRSAGNPHRGEGDRFGLQILRAGW